MLLVELLKLRGFGEFLRTFVSFCTYSMRFSHQGGRASRKLTPMDAATVTKRLSVGHWPLIAMVLAKDGKRDSDSHLICLN